MVVAYHLKKPVTRPFRFIANECLSWYPPQKLPIVIERARVVEDFGLQMMAIRMSRRQRSEIVQQESQIWRAR